jgi:peptidoglycan/LPS O-acetylase OafA/YrhL
MLANMSPVSPAAALIAVLVAQATGLLIMKRVGVPASTGRFMSLDGLRGYLAFSVFIFHSACWYVYLRTGLFQPPPSNLFAHLGRDGVLLFFMITGFLFWSKLIDARRYPIDWTKLYISRGMRLIPLYLVAFSAMIFMTALLTHFTLREPLPALLRHAFVWLTFSVLGHPDINGNSAATFMLGINWTLSYEWFFYFSLPLLGLSFRQVPPLQYLALSVATVVIFAIWVADIDVVYGFVGGIIAAFAVRAESIKSRASGTAGALTALAVLAAAVWIYPNPSKAVIALLTVAFTIIACGNSLFGLLTSAVARTLGEMSYSIYLLHQALLFVTFEVIIGPPRAAAMSPTAHWLAVFAISAVLVLLCSLTFRFIEAPAMHAVPRMHTWIKTNMRSPRAYKP